MDDSEFNMTPTSGGDARDSNSTSTTRSGASFSNDNGPTFGMSGSYHKSTTDANNNNNNNTPTFKTMQNYGVDHDQGSESGSDDDSSESASAQTTEELRKKTEEDNAYRAALAKSETKAIRRLKLALILLLLCVAATIATLVYLFTSEVEQSEFEDEFLEQGSKLVTGFYADSFQKMQALESLSSGLTFQFLNHTWPFVTIPRSHEYFQPFLSLANAASIKLLPIVHARQRLQWEEHVANTQGWVVEDLAKQQQQQEQQIVAEGVGHEEEEEELEEGNDTNNKNNGRSLQYFGDADENSRVSPFIKNYVGIDTSPRIWTPSWQYAPVIPNNWFINFNQLADAEFKRDFKEIYKNKQAVIAKAETYLPGLDFQSTRDLTFTEQLLEAGGYGQYEPGEPIGYIHYPVFEDPEESDTIVAIITATVYWKTYFQGILPDNVKGIVCVVENEEQTFTYRIDGTRAIFMGMDDMHDPIYDELEISADYKAFETVDAETTGRPYTGVPVDETRLAYRIRVYPSKEMEEQYATNEPILYATVVAAVMLFAVLVFVVYDCYVERRQKKVSNVAVQSNAIVSSLFPTSVKEKLFKIEESQNQSKQSKRREKDNAFKNPALQQSPTKRALRSFGGGVSSVVTGGSDESKKRGKGSKGFNNLDDINELDPITSSDESNPIADFFPSATVLFMDIAGFTAWSSSREPSQVFLLLETIYRSFDKIANRRRVFKVETIGDCYMAVCGLPEPCANHAPVMASFARDCLDKMDQLVHKLVPKLGPETTELQVRVGLHSGPVTAGVLRGDRARFQLFGDTVNTASRMESTGKPGHIQCSQESAELISAGGRQKWLRERPDAIHAKGKGELQTFWIAPKSARTASTTSSNPFMSNSTPDPIACMSDESNRFPLGTDDTEAQDPAELEREILEQKLQGLVDFNYDILLNILKDIIAKHTASRGRGSSRDLMGTEAEPGKVRVPLESGKKSCLDEVAAIIELPNFDHTAYERERSMGVEVRMEVKQQLRMYCEEIARMYCENPFHGWEHASHVVQSSSKLLSRIVGVKEIGTGAQAHDATFGITSDPLTQFAVIFSAMIHDVDHRGVPNSILAKEQPEMAKLYQNHAIAEQNSVDIAWNLLMEPTYSDLRGAIYHGQTEMKRFRQLVVNCLMGTDIFDKKLKAIREQRWQKAFHTQSERKKINQDEFYEEEEQEAINRKATIVIEHIIQASDVSHCMQHWHVYSKWNEKLFNEMYKAYKDGRSTTDPTDGWYKGELWFFDNYVIPLAQKLEECGVFGVSSDEFLIYARANRAEWEKKGESIVEANVKRIKTWLEEEKGRENLMQLPTTLPFEEEEEHADMERIKSYLKQGQQEQQPEKPKNEVGTNLRSAMKSESSFSSDGSNHLSSVEVWTGISASPQKKKRSIVESDTSTIESQLSC